jgi:hypothetical protein
VNKFPCASFSSDLTSDVICPAVLYALDPTTGIVLYLYQIPTTLFFCERRSVFCAGVYDAPVGAFVFLFSET